MALHVIVGAGPVGKAVARTLLARGEQVRVVTRSGSGIDGTERIAANATDADRLTEIATGAVAIYNCVNPPYKAKAWQRDWPPINQALMSAAERTGAVLAVTDNLYAYGPVDGAMTEDLPDASAGRKGAVRAQLWRDLRTAHVAGRIKAVAVRGSDYVVGNSMLDAVILPALRKGRTAYVPADLDTPHTWTNTADVAELLVTVALDERAWGRIWHVPSAPAASVRELTELAARQLGVPAKVKSIPGPLFYAVGVVVPIVRELRETQYQWRRPFVLDTSAAEHTFGLTATPLEQSVAMDIAAVSA